MEPVRLSTDEQRAAFEINRARASQRYVSLLMTGQLYTGNVPYAEVQRRRAANKRARRSRRINRLRNK